MLAPISAKDKQNFIKWFLLHYKMKKRESAWILEYLVNHTTLLKNVHFVRDIKFCPRGLIISSRCSDEVPLLFFKQNLVTKDPEKLFHDMRLNNDEPLYIQLNFNNAVRNSLYVTILEDNPYLPDDLEEIQQDRVEASRMLTYTLFINQKRVLKQEIDLALDNLDHDCFLKLVEELKTLELNYNNQMNT